VIEVHNRDAGRPQSKDAPRDGRAPEVKDSHVRKARETALEFFSALLTETMSKGSRTVRINKFSNCFAGQGVNLSPRTSTKNKDNTNLAYHIVLPHGALLD
jgi:hypothetical protein